MTTGETGMANKEQKVPGTCRFILGARHPAKTNNLKVYLPKKG